MRKSHHILKPLAFLDNISDDDELRNKASFEGIEAVYSS